MQQTPAIKDWLADASNQLSAIDIPSANLDAELILANILEKDRTFLHAHNQQILTNNQIIAANADLSLRLKRVPIAYIVGYKEFYGRQFLVTPATLIPRPESEAIIEILANIMSDPKNFDRHNTIKLVDVGTGSGCLGITAKLEFPELDVALIDISNEALKVAKLNAKKLSADVQILQSDLLQNYSAEPDIIIANLPYVDKKWDRSPETEYEPDLALFADNNGLSVIEKLIIQASKSLKKAGHIIIEADPAQHDAIISLAKKQALKLTDRLGYIIAFTN